MPCRSCSDPVELFAKAIRYSTEKGRDEADSKPS
jgi:hypothetical protein